MLAAARETATDARIVETGPPGAAGLTPMVMAMADERTAIHTRAAPARARELVETLDAGEVPTDGVHEEQLI